MTRILCSGDHHFDEHGRFSECLRIHDWMVSLAREERVDLFVSGGDVYERASTPREREAVANWLTSMAELCPVVIAKGNHDRELDCTILGRLRTRFPVIVEERAAVHHVAGVAVATVAWPDRANILASAGSNADEAMQDALRSVLRGLGEQLDAHKGPTLLLGHFMCDGAVTSTGQPLLGQPIRVGLTDLGLARADLTIMGHIHRAQRFTHEGRPIWYPGSPFRTDFGQTEQKIVLLADFEELGAGGADGGGWPRVDEIQTPATPMIHVYAEWCPDWAVSGDGCSGEPGLYTDGPIPDVKGAEVRLRYGVEAEYREPAKVAAAVLRAELLERGAISVKLEEIVEARSAARLPEVAQAHTTADRLRAFWTAKQAEPEPARAERLIGKLGDLEGEDHAA